MSVKEGLSGSVEGLPVAAFAIAGNRDNRETWQLPHHGRSITRALKGKLDIERTVDWQQLMTAVETLAYAGRSRWQVTDAGPGAIIEAARHLAGHYHAAGKPLPDILAALV